MNNDATLGVITNAPYGVFQRAVISGVEQVAAKQGYNVKVYASLDVPHYFEGLMSQFNQLTGVLVIANAAENHILRTLYQNGKPISMVSHQVHSLPIPVVVSNNIQGTAELVRHVVMGCGRRKLAFIRGIPDQNDAQEREIAFRQELIRYNLSIPNTRLLKGDFDPETAAASVKKLVKSGEAFDGIVAADYVMANAAVEALRKAGVRVPEDVSVVGFGDDVEAENAGLTTVAANIVELGSCAARQLISQINGLRISGVTMLSVRLIVRETCGYKDDVVGR